LEPVRIRAELGFSLTEFYETRVRQLNWLVHGSGAAILGHAPPSWFHLNFAMGLKWSSDFGELISILTTRAFRFSDAIQNMNDEWTNLRRHRNEALMEALRKDPGYTA
jgi:hypothetical protein